MKINPDTRKGSALIVAVIFTAGLAAAIASYLTLSNGTTESSHRAFYRAAAFNLAESGVEHALWALHKDRVGESPWDEWTLQADGTRHFRIDGFTFAGGITGSVDISLLGDPYNPNAGGGVKVTAIGSIERRGKKELSETRILQADLQPSGGRGLFAYGMLARGHIRASGGARFDSWNSRENGVFQSYRADLARDNVGVATVSDDLGAIQLGSSDIYGRASVGSESEFGLVMGWGGHLGPLNESDWDPEDLKDLWKVDGRKISYSTGAITTHFTAEFEEVIVPAELMPIATSPYVLPYHTQPYNRYVNRETLGAPGVDTVLMMDRMTIEADSTLEIAGNVTLIFPSENMTSLIIRGSGKIQLQEDATLVIYTGGNVDISGAGLLNHVAPEQLQIWGTASESQNIYLSGSGYLNGLIYAPNADLIVPGNTKIYGSVVANNITMSGSGSLHYDESLREYQGMGGSSGPLTVQHIREIMAKEEREPYLDLVANN
ncbi:MAG TPA: collagen-binding domain-containing protein [Opitutales bacterium]|nr:collagen-binding domain-containing protein [Opitutales bacterium]